MRVFFGIPIPERTKQDISAQIRELQGRYPGLSWVNTENYHITLLFIGETEQMTAAGLCRALRRGGMPYSFYARLSGVHQFPPRGRARVIFAALEEGVQGCEKMYEFIMHTPGFQRYDQKRRYEPHITLARVKKGRRAPDPTRLSLNLTSGFRIDRFNLYRSTLKSTGAEYSVLDEFNLT